jgi:hypothetical protein
MFGDGSHQRGGLWYRCFPDGVLLQEETACRFKSKLMIRKDRDKEM